MFKFFITLVLVLNFYFGNASDTKELDFCKNPELYSGIKLHHGYWDIFRGRGNFVRLVCELSQVSYTEHVFGGFLPDGTFDFANWFGNYKALVKKIDPDSNPNLPFLVDCTNTSKTKFLTETLDLLIYVAEKYNPRLIGEGLSIERDHLLKFSRDLYETYSLWPNDLFGNKNPIEAVINSDDYFADDELIGGPIFVLQKIEEIVKNSIETYGGPLMFGTEPTIADIIVFEYAAVTDSLFPGIIYDSPYIRELLDAFSEVPLVSKFLSSSRAVLYPPVVSDLMPFQLAISFDPWKKFSTQLLTFGNYLTFYGHSESTSAASICLSYKIFSIASLNGKSEIFNDIFGLLQFSQITDIGTRIVGRNALVRLWNRMTRRLSSTRNRIKNSCVAVITSGKYHDTSITEEVAEEICASFSRCYNSRGSIWSITRSLINSKERFKFFGGSTSVFNTERYIKKYVTSPLAFGKAIRTYYYSKVMLKSGSLPKNSIVDLLTEMQSKGVISTFGLTLNKNVAVRMCVDYYTNKTPIEPSQFRDSYSLELLCETAFQPYHLSDSPKIDEDKLSSFVTSLEKISN